MAQLSNLDRIWTAPPGTAVTVGNNRTITRETRADGVKHFVCRLHGAPVAIIVPHGAAGTVSVRLDACGYLTTTTIRAMSDFIGAFGVAGAASRAGGILSARWHYAGEWHERDSSDGDLMSFVADRHPIL